MPLIDIKIVCNEAVSFFNQDSFVANCIAPPPTSLISHAPHNELTVTVDHPAGIKNYTPVL
jgi:hypothetical protein